MYREKTMPVIVERIEIVTPVIKRFTLAALSGDLLPPFSSGSHVTTYIESKNRTLARQYSLNNHPEQTASYQISIRLSETSNGGSLYWHQHIKVGDHLYISYPKNHFPLSFKAKHHVFYAAGIGITPFLSMIAELQENGGSFELHFTAKKKELCAFYSFLKEQYPERCHFYFTQEDGAECLSVRSLLQHSIGTHIYFCGPESFISSFTKAAISYGYPKSSIHFEHFTPSKQGRRAAFQVELNNGRTVHVSENQTLLEALLASGIEAPHSCRVGRCGTCELQVREGEVEHYDSFLSEEQRGSGRTILTCVSRAKTNRLVLDWAGRET